jgi:hypothetical protein
MDEPPDLETLARRFLALWQEQFLATAGDPELGASLARTMGLAGAALAPWGAMVQAMARGDDGDAAPAAADRTPAAPAPPGHGGDAVAELARRLAALEERLAQLEAGARGSGPRARDRARRRRS